MGLNYLVSYQSTYAFIAVFLFLGLYGIIFYSRNLVTFLVYSEVLFLGIGLLFVVTGTYLGNPLGDLFALTLFTIAAAEAALGFSLLILLLNQCSTLFFKDFSMFH